MFQKSSGSEKVYGSEGGMGEYQNCPSKIFRLAVSKKAVGEAFSLSFVSCIEEKCFRGLFLFHDFLSKIFFSQFRKVL